MVEEVVKVTRHYQVTIPAAVRAKAGIKEGDLVKVVYDEAEGVIKIVPLRKRRLTLRAGKKISVEEMEEAVEEMMIEATS
ncbi:hypothetical protein PYJP_17160 [Pyrofollis japonicus]|uniref:AbrB/MazE/SpoVT family DNA-binding domain-containing protein n=1 Tax=Pyrofollis japonicus TaxID=3060460 RepID=UPI00295A86E0|nr:AbrB/MazE/SpoVT family DNA-binding domain-containing protein [Pyrofollis japonicus]BEP18364.1 hypothetical protein PYJP_17160 [Pyrofollis japonicus]